jgi:histidyl-tRNA synthetase
LKTVKPTLLRGFDQEYLPREQLQFNALVDIIRRNFELFGFLPIETPSAERKEVLTSKGGVEKEIYALTRLAAAADDDEAATKGALRFDLTVPLARYVAMRERELAFPFRRYQIQRVWRGETPQARKGRFREFYQCDIDIVGRDKLSYLAEAEIPSVIHSVFQEMGIGKFRIRINNRKVLKGLLQHFKIPDRSSAVVLRVLDKVEKEDVSKIRVQLEDEGIPGPVARDLLSLVSEKRDTSETLAVLSKYEECAQGVTELKNVVEAIRQFGVPDTAFGVDLNIVRGLDYYTGTIYETTLEDYPELGSICSGGRYDDLAGYFTDTRLPGVGISIGLTRLFAKLREAGLLKAPLRTPAEVLVTRMEGQDFGAYLKMARMLRGASINTEVYLEPAKLKHQLAYAEKKGFRLALIAGETEFSNHAVQVKNLATRTAAECPLTELVATVENILQKPSSLKAD